MATRTCRTASMSLVRGRLRAWAARCRDRGLNLLLPPRCAYCDGEMPSVEHDTPLCGPCSRSLAPEDWTFCRRCGARASPDHPAPESCAMCAAQHLRFDSVVSLGDYHSELREAVLRMKHREGDTLSAAMGWLLCLRRGDDVAAFCPHVVAPVPMFWGRRLVRGTNSPDILAEVLARHLRLPLERGMVVRSRNTLPQRTLKPKQRFAGVRGAFRLPAGYDLEGRRVVLVDDILTTGATASEIARLLKRKGASQVVVATLARGTGEHPSRVMGKPGPD